MMFLPSARKKNFESRGHSPQFRIWTQQLPARAQAGVTYMICASKVFESMQLSLCLFGYWIICTSLEISHSFSGICGKKSAPSPTFESLNRVFLPALTKPNVVSLGHGGCFPDNCLPTKAVDAQ